MKIDINTRRPVLKNNVGGLSGPAVFPVALRMVWQVANAVSIPVVGMGGIEKWQDAVEMLLAGASALQMGAAIFADPYAPLKVIDGLNEYLDSHNIGKVTELVGKKFNHGKRIERIIKTMKIMAVDFGDARTGLAVCDKTEFFGFSCWGYSRKRF